jgi:aminoglycoside 6'-N-acetyltransferase I
MRIRRVEPVDLDAWAAMRGALYADADADELRRECAHFFAHAPATEAVFVAEGSDGRLVGLVELGLRSYAEGCRSSPVPYLEGWYVAPEARRSGVGRALVEAAEAWALALGHFEIASDALIDNRVSHDAHAALGFKEIERSVHFRKALPRRQPK